MDGFKPSSIEINTHDEKKYTLKLLDKEELTKETLKRLALWEKLNSNYILKFYGIFYDNTIPKALFEKPELGNLNEVYSKYNIPWPTKVN